MKLFHYKRTENADSSSETEFFIHPYVLAGLGLFVAFIALIM